MTAKPASTHKKVLVETFKGEARRGYLNPRHLDRAEGLELLGPAGQLHRLPWKQVRVAWLVRDWEEPVPRAEQMLFSRRPRVQGVWVRLRFRDGQTWEGLLVNDLQQWSPQGYLLTPPNLNGAHQKAFVPRTALASVEVLGVNPSRSEPRRPRRRPAAEAGRQPALFGE